MDIRTLLGKSYSLTKFAIETEQSIEIETLIENLQIRGFQSLEDVGIEKNGGFVTAIDCYKDKPVFAEENTVFSYGRFAVFAYRYDIKSIDASAMKRKVAIEEDKLRETLKAQYPDRETIYLSKEAKASIKAAVKEELLKTAHTKTKLIPLIIDIQEKVGYLFTQSEKAVGEILDDLNSVLTDFESQITILQAYDAQIDFGVNWQEMLTWYWWRSETDQFFDIDNQKVFVGDDLELGFFGENKKISAKGAGENVRTSITEGAIVNKLLLSSETMNKDIMLSFNITNNAIPSNLKFLDPKQFFGRHEDDDTLLLDLVGTFNVVLEYGKSIAEAYKTASNAGQVVSQSVRDSWGRGDFCTRSFEDI